MACLKRLLVARFVAKRRPLRRVIRDFSASGHLGLGVVGAVVPILPTTPFLLLATACFARSSSRLHYWLLHNRVFGETLRRYHNGEGLPLALKLTTLILLWGTLSASAFLAVPARLFWVRVFLLVVGLGVTFHILQLRTRNRRSR
jgi:uncharacterized protein